MSAAASGRGLSRTSSWPFSSICQARARAGIGKRSARLAARARSASLAAGSPLSFSGGLDQRYGMYGIGEIADDLPWLGAVPGEPGERAERTSGIAGQYSLEQVEDAGAVGETEQSAHGIVLDLSSAECDGAVQDR